MTRPPDASGPVFPKTANSKLPDVKKKDMPPGLWTKCPDCGTYIFNKELEGLLMVCKGCQHHFTATPKQRIDSLLDPGTWEEFDSNLAPIDALNFTGYVDQLKRYQKKNGTHDSVVSGLGTICDHRISMAIMDFQFIGGSMGVVAGEKITRAIERATQARIPVLIFSASGGARMHEGMFSLLQMGKTSAALQRHAAKKLPFISILTNPTMGGVTASFATLGDVILAEPKAKIGFAGERVLRETTGEGLPKNFQTAEFLLERGLIDRIVPRHQLRGEIANILNFLMHRPAGSPGDSLNRAKSNGKPRKETQEEWDLDTNSAILRAAELLKTSNGNTVHGLGNAKENGNGSARTKSNGHPSHRPLNGNSNGAHPVKRAAPGKPSAKAVSFKNRKPAGRKPGSGK